MKSQHQNSRLFLLIVMGLLSAFGPFITDLYLPSLPSIAAFFKTSSSMVQLSLTSSMIGIGVGQLLIGPISDKYGRKRLLVISLGLFILSTSICLFSWNIESFVVFRLFQGIAGAGSVVISKSVATDLYKGKELNSFFSMLMVISGVGPIAAPVLGGVLLQFANWKGIFLALLFIGIALFLTSLRFNESLPVDRRKQGSVFSTFKLFIPALKHSQFMFFVLIQGFGMGVMFTYIASSPFILQQHYHLSPLMYSLCFALNGLGLMIGSGLVSTFRKSINALSLGIIGLVGMGFAFVATLLLALPFVWVEASLFLLLLFLGLLLPTSAAMGLNLERKNAGTASALIGFFPFLFGSIVSPLTGLGNMLYSTSLLTVICCLCTLFFGIMVRRIKDKDVSL